MNFSYLLLFSLLAFLALYPDDFWLVVFYYTVKIKTMFLNLVLLATSYWIYRKLIRDLESHGLKAPPFKFVPIEDRQQ